MGQDSVQLSLSKDEALVLFEWLNRFNKSDTSFEDQAEQRVLWNLEAQLESSLVEPLEPDYLEKLESARARVRDSNE